MFPIDEPTLHILLLIGIFLSSALAMCFSWNWRVLLLFVAVCPPVALLWPDPPTGQYAGLKYILVIGASSAAMVIGVVVGSLLRRFAIAHWVLGAIAAVAAIFVLWHQYVPNACLGSPLPVRIAGVDLFIPPEMRARLEAGESVSTFGAMDRKSDYARLCRESRNGARAIEVDTIWLWPASTHAAMTTACSGSAPPAWCRSYSPDPYRHIGRVLIAPASHLGFPRDYWNSGSSKYDKQGDLAEGSICLMSSVTQCWIWGPFGDDSRLIVSTSNLDKIFANMSVEEARDMIVKTREMTVSIISR